MTEAIPFSETRDLSTIRMTPTSLQLTTMKIVLGETEISLTGPLEWQDSGPRLSYWWQPTAAAIALAVHLLGVGSLAQKRVLDLGCGLGLSGIAAGLAGADVVFMDAEATAIDFARYNASCNGLSLDRADFSASDWEDVVQMGSFDFVIGSEILYDYFSHGDLINFIQAHVADDGSVVLADRKRLCVSRFLGRMRDKGFHCNEQVVTSSKVGFPIHQIGIFELKPSKSLDEIT